LPEAMALYHLGFNAAKWKKVLNTLSIGFLAFLDSKTSVVWVVNMFRYQARGAKNIQACVNHIPNLHKSFLVKKFLDKYPEVKAQVPDRVYDTLTIGVLSGSGSGSVSGSEENTCRVQAKTPEIDVVVGHYQKHHPRSHPGRKERDLIRMRLADGFSASDLCTAIDGNHRSPYHCGENDKGRKYHGLELVMRNASKVEGFILDAETNFTANGDSAEARSARILRRSQ
ncbi:MAG: hypothetical protein GY953_42185, partial [bacterium]|nr:hypothetical protein [bacterium]